MTSDLSAIQVHWINSSSDPASTGGVATVRLEAGLSGPFDSVDELKAAEGGTATITARGARHDRAG